MTLAEAKTMAEMFNEIEGIAPGFLGAILDKVCTNFPQFLWMLHAGDTNYLEVGVREMEPDINWNDLKGV